ncbi:putative membrane protein [Catalinimonas alkaloidigena]|uniref:Putative membrane protein n=1 Tax=Catalinimonas alkaloidigena TaxID=1075417 RepID=A0A1G9E1Q6_9BACT|nr:DUF368 domain-containing protein [Catalinimonas alkaloidigena]SDK70043.1 putative membrane protein [Catalinimonas alkaloidigena]
MRTIKENLLLFARGLAMGAADVVPGVSGGTIAFITGIYEELLGSIQSVNAEAIRLLVKGHVKAFWQHINGNFLLVLFAGIGFSIITLSRIVLYALANIPELLWSFFFGLIVASAWVVGRKVSRWTVPVVVALLLGVVAAYLITEATPAETPTAAWFIFLSGAIAICAMILPGISGSFILVLLAKYEYILNAVKQLDVVTILTFILGCLVGILSFSRLLKWMLEKYHNLTVALLTGFMVGSLNKVWPWKETISTYTDRHGEVKPLVQENVLPLDYLDLTGREPYLFSAVALALVGFAVVYLIDHLAVAPEAVAEEAV